MRSSSPQPRTVALRPQAPSAKSQSGIPRCSNAAQKKSASAEIPGADFDVYSENQLLGRLLKDMQAKLSVSSAEVKQLSEDLKRRDMAMKGLQVQFDRCRKQLEELQLENEALKATSASLAEQKDRALSQREQFEGVVLDLTLQLQGKAGAAARLQDRCDELEVQLQQLRAGGVTAEQVSQQLQRVESMYRSRLEAVKEDCREKLAAQEAAARARIADAQAATAQMMSGLKRAAAREVQRAEAALEGKVMDQLRVMDQLAKRCRALETRTMDMRPLVAAVSEARVRVGELESRLRQAEEAAAPAAALSAASGCCGCCYSCTEPSGAARDSVAEPEAELAVIQRRLEVVRGELVEQAALVAQLQSELVNAQQGRVAAEERLEAVEATCRELRIENVALRTQLLDLTAPSSGASGRASASAGEAWNDSWSSTASAAGTPAASREREATAHSAALRAAEADAVSREMLRSARREQVAASLALLSQLRRMQALEIMRLDDMQEINNLERRLAALRKERTQTG